MFLVVKEFYENVCFVAFESMILLSCLVWAFFWEAICFLSIPTIKD